MSAISLMKPRLLFLAFALALPAFGAEKPEALLQSALKKMSAGTWSVNGTATSKKTIKLHGLLAGKDFDLTMEPGTKPDVPMRGIVIGEKAWVCSDGSSWHSGSSQDRMIYNLVHTPLIADPHGSPFEEVGREQRDGATWLHLQLKVPEKDIDPKELPQYWLVLNADGVPLYVGRAEMPMVTRGTSDVTLCAFDYAPAKTEIAPPPDATEVKKVLAPPMDEQVHGFNEIETHKFDWAGKIVRVSTTPKLLQSEDLGGGTFRVMLKDIAQPLPAYGQVEFPGAGLIAAGFLKKTVPGGHNWTELAKVGALGRTEGEPVSFYVQVIPIGQKRAARVVAMGSKMLRDAEGKASYSW